MPRVNHRNMRKNQWFICFNRVFDDCCVFLAVILISASGSWVDPIRAACSSRVGFFVPLSLWVAFSDLFRSN